MSKETSRIPELFGSCVFNEETMLMQFLKNRD